jgi:hypothetical protein
MYSFGSISHMQDVVAGVWNVKHQTGEGMLRDGKHNHRPADQRE